MYKAELSLMVLQFIGCWQPKFPSQCVYILYNIYCCFMIFVIYFFTFTTIMYLFRYNYNLEEFTENFFFSLALLCATIKIGNLLIKRNKIIELIEMLIDERFNPQDYIEFQIQNKFDKISRYLLFFIYL